MQAQVRHKAGGQQFFHKLWSSKGLAFLAGLGGLGMYLVQAVREAHLQTTMVDEGLYLYTGWLYVQRVLQPFQDYGIYRAYAPLSILVPGQIEAWFGPGLRTGRFFSVVVSGLMLLALWLAARKWAGEGLAAAVIWAMAASPLATKLYSLATPHALVACLLAWSLYLIMGAKSFWRISLGALAAGTCVMVRHNMVLLLPLLVAYVWCTGGGEGGYWHWLLAWRQSPTLHGATGPTFCNYGLSGFPGAGCHFWIPSAGPSST